MKTLLFFVLFAATSAFAQEYRGLTIPQLNDSERDSGHKVNKLLQDAMTGAHPLATSGGAGGAVSLPTYTASTPAQATLNGTASSLVAAAVKPRKVSIMNNSGAFVWIAFGGATPVGDTNPGATGNGGGNGYGILIAPNGYFETPEPIKEQIKAVASTNGINVTVVIYAQD